MLTVPAGCGAAWPAAAGRKFCGAHLRGGADNPKGTLDGRRGRGLPGKFAAGFPDGKNGMDASELWEERDRSAPCGAPAPVSGRARAWRTAVRLALSDLRKWPAGEASRGRNGMPGAVRERLSLQSSFNRADAAGGGSLAAGAGKQDPGEPFYLWQLEAGALLYRDALKAFGTHGIDGEIFSLLMEDAGTFRFFAEDPDLLRRGAVHEGAPPFLRPARDMTGWKRSALTPFRRPFSTTRPPGCPPSEDYRIARDRVDVELPDPGELGRRLDGHPAPLQRTGRHGAERRALKLNGIYPIQIRVERLSEPACGICQHGLSALSGHGRTAVEEIQDCHNPYDPFALHKAALIACGIVPLDGERGVRSGSGDADDAQESLPEICSPPGRRHPAVHESGGYSPGLRPRHQQHPFRRLREGPVPLSGKRGLRRRKSMPSCWPWSRS